MEPTSIFRRHRKLLFAMLFLLSGIFSRLETSFAAEPEQGGSVHQIEATVVHVDQYAVYAPNVVFYYDTQMDKRKVATLMKTAEQLRNRKAVITYSSAGGPGQDKRVLLVDIAPSGVGKSGQEKPSHEKPIPTDDSQRKPANNVPANEVPTKEDVSREPDTSSTQTTQQEKKQSGNTGLSSPITRDELTAFVRRILELNEKKDLAAIEPLYADKVDYYDRGIVGRDYVLRDLGYYYHNWETINTALEGDVVMIVLDQPEVRIAKFLSSYSVRKGEKSLAGKTENIWKIQRINGKLKLIDVKQKMLGKGSPGQ